MASKLKRERLLHHVDAIYGCVIDPSKWDATLAGIIDDLDFYNSIMSVISASSGLLIVQTAVRVPPEYARMMSRYGGEVVASWGGEAKLLSLPQGEPVVQSNVTPLHISRNMAWFIDWANPQGLFDAVAIALMRGGIVANVAFGRHVSKGPITELELAPLRLLAPHFARAFEITALLDMSRARSTTFWEALEVIASGVVLINAEGRVVRTNAVAGKMLADGDPVFERGSRLQLRGEPIEAKAFENVLSSAIAREARGTGIIGVPGRWRDGRRCVAHVMPLRGQSDANLTGASAAVFIAESGQARPPRESLALLFDLTPAELRIVELISEGKSRTAIANQLSIAPATVKVHLRSIFRKTSTSRQPALVHLIRGLSLPG